MTQDEIIEMARQANLDREPPDEYCRAEYWTATFEDLEALIKLAAAKEREACAEICDDQAGGAYWEGADACANRIRARGQT